MNRQRRDKCKRCYIHVIYPNLSMLTVNVYAIISSAVSARLQISFIHNNFLFYIQRFQIQNGHALK